MMLIAGCLVNPGWIPEFLNSGGTKFMQTFGQAPSLWGLSGIICGGGQNCMIGLGSMAAVCILVGFIFLIIMRKDSITNAQAVSLSTTLALMVTTHVWPYDQLLLALPIIFVTMEFAVRGNRYLLNAMMIFVIDLLAVVIFLFNMKAQNEIASVFLTVVVLGLVVYWIFTNPKNEMVNHPVSMASHPSSA
jgi:hypothetical protein